VSSSFDRSLVLTYFFPLQDEVLTWPESYLSPSQHSTRSVSTSSFYAVESNLSDMSISPLLAHNDEVELTDEEDDSGRDSIKSASDPNDEDEEMAVDHMLVSNCRQHYTIADSRPFKLTF
jgi:hypothetical protein